MLIRKANIIRARSIVNGSPTPAQCETINRVCKSLNMCRRRQSRIYERERERVLFNSRQFVIWNDGCCKRTETRIDTIHNYSNRYFSHYANRKISINLFCDR